MRRLPVIFAVGAALVAPVVALAANGGSTDGSLVVHNGQAPVPGPPVVVLSITGSVIGNVDHGRIIIDGGPLDAGSSRAPQVTAGAACVRPTGDTRQICKGDNFSFRAVGGHYTVLLYGTGIDVVAVGSGWVRLAGIPDVPVGDGRYSVNGGDFASLPGIQTDKLLIGTTG